MNARALAVVVVLAAGCGASSTPPVAPAVTSQPAVSQAAPLAHASPPSLPAGWSYTASPGAPNPNGMVVSDSTIGTNVGAEMLKDGGNAADAAVATALAMAVAFPTAGNLGGGGFAVARFGVESLALDFRETAPASASRDMYVEAAGKAGEGSRKGWRASGVPGSVAGLYALHQKKGSKPWAEVVAPAIKLATDGFTVDTNFAEEVADSKDRLLKDPGAAALFFPNGEPPKVGSTFKNPEIAAVLRDLAKDGPKAFYEGAAAHAIADAMKANGGAITLEDMRAYSAKWRTPIEIDYRGRHIVAMPPPSSGGVTIAMIANILSGYDMRALGWHSPDALHDEFEAMRRAFAARNAKLGDPDFVKNPLTELLSPAWAASQRTEIIAHHATPSAEIPSAAAPPDPPHTTNLCVVDKYGNAIALTTTLNWWFGSGVVVPGTGIVMNNEMDDFASVPGRANGFGLVQGEPNAIAPGKRMLSSMSPVVVLGSDGKPSLVAGGAGGPRIITAVFQILSNAIDYDMDPVAAVDAPRFHMQHLPDVVLFEKGGLQDDLKSSLGKMGYTFKELGHLADANAIERTPAGWIGAPEPRRAGSLAAGP